VGGAKKRPPGHASSSYSKKRRRKPSAATVRIENGEIRPLREIDEGVAEDVATTTSSRRSDRRRSRVDMPLNGGGGAHTPGVGQVGGPSKTSIKEKDELNHIIPESKKFPQVG